MNKNIIITVLVVTCLLCAVSVATTDLSLVPTDAMESANLKMQHRGYANFCVRARDHVVTNIFKANRIADDLFELIFRTQNVYKSSLLHLRNHTKDVCDHIDQYLAELLNLFARTKDPIASEFAFGINAKFEEINCMTLSKIRYVNNICSQSERH